MAVLVGCSSDDDNVFDGDGNTPGGHIPKAYAEVELIGDFVGSFSISSYDEWFVNESYGPVYDLNQKWIFEEDLKTEDDYLRVYMSFLGTYLFEDYEPARVKILTKLDDEIITQIDTLVIDYFTHNEDIKR